ncbi:2-oxoacid:acceptor oxidoreductase subunit alpha [bacterium]|nr:2-oxoacid:acceptor oxidoreductase subunit alpha [bacterium]
MSTKKIETLERVTIRFAGDSGDGMQLTGSQFTDTTAIVGNDLTTLPDYPSEIRAPAGTLFGVSGFQIQFSSQPVRTPGDEPDVLVAMNPAALKVNLPKLLPNAIIILNTDAFTAKNLQLAKFEQNPIEDDSLNEFQVFPVAITALTREALKETSLKNKEKDRSKNFFALGMTYWMFTRPLDITNDWIKQKFKSKPEIVEANIAALKAGYNFAFSTEIFTTSYKISEATKRKGTYRNITGNEATALGLIAAAQKAGKELFLGSYPITPASEILHALSKYRNYDVKTFQAEDEIAGIGSAIGASFAGDVAVTTTSGPGLSLKSEFMGLAVMLETPLVIVNVQRGGPSTGLPTKTEQSDLLQAMYGRNGEAPIPIIAAKSPADCFRAAYEAVEVAFKYTTPVILQSDGYIGNGAEPWLIPEPEDLPEIEIKYADNAEKFKPYERNPETLARTLAIPGMAGFEHRIGGLEKEDITGILSQDPDNHQKMTDFRAKKVENVNDFAKEPEFNGNEEGDLLILSWGSTYGAIYTALKALKTDKNVSWCHLRWVNPLPRCLGEKLSKFKKILIPEVNAGQLIKLVREKYLVDAVGFNRVKGQPLSSHELMEDIESQLKGL